MSKRRTNESSNTVMIGSTWKNGKKTDLDSSYGIRIKKSDRDGFLVREWGCAFLMLEGESNEVRVNIDKDSLWDGTCLELINMGIRAWLRKHDKDTWPDNKPHQVKLEPSRKRRRFKVTFESK